MRKSVLAIGFLFAVNAWGQTMGVTNRPGFDADTNNPLQKSWVSEGNLTPIPAKRLTVKLYKDGLQVASTRRAATVHFTSTWLPTKLAMSCGSN